MKQIQTGIPIRTVNPAARRATAEIELLLIILLVLIPLLLLLGATAKLGTARVANVFDAENQAYTQVIAHQNITTSPLISPIDATATLSLDYADLPNRMDVAAPTYTVIFNQQISTTPVKHVDTAAFLDPAWFQSSETQIWFENYAADLPNIPLLPPPLSRLDLKGVLGLQPSFPP